ncbi:MAG TPA: flagellar basal body-associated FliL family protein [Syntrophales bacterium]|nr:flagellar basal body-associated FliL family protein [Syntrophales bacterium]HQC24284.1 flagellar basal body-associated FliL family protein [Syntrophales bacterium]
MAKEAEKNKPEEQAAEGGREKKKGSALKWIIVAAVVLLVLGGGGAGAYFFLNKSAGKKAQAPAKPPIGAVWAPDVFIINLADTDADRYLKITMNFELSDGLAVAELDQMRPKVRDMVLGVLTVKSFKDLNNFEGKQRLKEEIAMRLNSQLTRGKVVQVYFTDFVVQ